MGALNQHFITLADFISLANVFNYWKIVLKENARFIHILVAQLHLAAIREASPKGIEQGPTDRLSCRSDRTPNNFRSITFGKGVGHR